MLGGKLAVFVVTAAGMLAQSPEDAAAQAIRAVKSVTSSTSSGVTFRAYSDRVLEARVRADQVPTLDPRLKLALEYYEAASGAWSLRFSHDPQTYQRGIAIGRKIDGFKDCKPALELVASLDASFKKKPPSADSRYFMLASLLSQRPNLLWSCAAAALDFALAGR